MQPGGDDFTARMLDAINGMMLDMLAAIARKDYEDRRRRQAQGIVKAKAEGVYRGCPEDVKRNEAITAMLRAGQSWNSISPRLAVHAQRCRGWRSGSISRKAPKPDTIAPW